MTRSGVRWFGRMGLAYGNMYWIVSTHFSDECGLNNSRKILPQASRKTFRGIQANFGGQKWKMGESGSWGDPHFNFYLHFWRNIHTATCPSFALCAMCVTWQNRETLVFILFFYPLIDVPSSYAPFCACQNYHPQIWVSRAIDPQHFLPPLFSS